MLNKPTSSWTSCLCDSPFLVFTSSFIDSNLLELVKSVGTSHLLQITLKWVTGKENEIELYMISLIFLCWIPFLWFYTSLKGENLNSTRSSLKVNFNTGLLVIPKAWVSHPNKSTKFVKKPITMLVVSVHPLFSPCCFCVILVPNDFKAKQ